MDARTPAVLAAAFLAGAVPFAWLIGRIVFGLDIRTVGSGNVGATNLARALLSAGKAAGLRRHLWCWLAFGLDVLKGFAAAFWVPALLGPRAEGRAFAILQIACGLAAVLGHVFTPFLRFRGGKGVATSCGIALGIAPVPALLALATWLLVLLASRYVSLASVVAAGLFPAYYGLLIEDAFGRGLPAFAVFVALALMILYRHRSNLLRIARGTERRWRAPENGEGGEPRNGDPRETDPTPG